MSWISDVKHDLGRLDVSIKSLRKFGLTVGLVFLILFAWFYYKDIFFVFRYLLLAAGIILLLLGLTIPSLLKTAYKVWMGAAFVLGWLVSRVILTFLFFLVLTPIGLIAKMVGKKFIDQDLDQNRKSTWIRKENSKVNYEKMF